MRDHLGKGCRGVRVHFDPPPACAEPRKKRADRTIAGEAGGLTYFYSPTLDLNAPGFRPRRIFIDSASLVDNMFKNKLQDILCVPIAVLVRN